MGGVVIKKKRREEEKELWGGSGESKRGRNMKGVKGGIMKSN
jgi:hypothetical protein